MAKTNKFVLKGELSKKPWLKECKETCQLGLEARPPCRRVLHVFEF